MIHQNHMPLDQRHEQARWKCAAVGGSRRIMVYQPCLRSFAATHLAVGAIQTVRALPTDSNAATFRASL
jgi:hypothetical protein